MKKITPYSFFRQALGLLASLALLPATASAASVSMQILEMSLYESGSVGTVTTGDEIHFYVRTDQDIDEDSIPPESDVSFKFYFSDHQIVHFAEFVSCLEDPDSHEKYMVFAYEIQEDDFSDAGVWPYEKSPIFGGSTANLRAVKTTSGDSIGNIRMIAAPSPEFPIDEELLVNPDLANVFTVNFLDDYGEVVPAGTFRELVEGQEDVRYRVNLGRIPTETVNVTINWGVAGIFATEDSTSIQLNESSKDFTIPVILDNGPAPNAVHEYTITAVKMDESGLSATMKARVKNTDPYSIGAFPGVASGTNYTYSVGETIYPSIIFDDIADTLDEPFSVSWKFGTQEPTETSVERLGSYWQATATGVLVREGNTLVSVTIRDKNGGGFSTNCIFYAERGPMLKANPAEANAMGLANIGEGSIRIVQPGAGTIPWDPNGNYLSAETASLQAIPATEATSSDGYDSFAYKWYCDEDQDKEPNDPTIALLSGTKPIAANANVNLLADRSAPINDRGPIDRFVLHFFSKEKYRPDNLGDIDGDGLPDVWEMQWLGITSLNFQDADGNPVVAAESGQAVYDDSNNLVYDFSGSGNLDGDGLPANSTDTIRYAIEEPVTLSGGFVIPAGEYDLNTFRYPLDSATIRKFGYLPLGSTRMPDEDEEASDIAAFKANRYVDEVAKETIERFIVNFDNELECRGIGQFLDFNDGFETIPSFRPIGDGDDPNTRPDNPDSDGDGMPDGWEYYFWAVAYYNIGSDQWLAFDGANPSGTSYLGTGAPISRDDILATFNPAVRGGGKDDLDNDGLSNLEELLYGTSPIHWDTDGDGLPDGWEVENGMMEVFSGGLGWCDMNGNQYEADNPAMIHPWNATPHAIQNGNLVEYENTDAHYIIVLNPLNGDDADFFEDYDYFAIDGDLRHYDVFLAHDFHPQVAWALWVNPQVSYAGNSFKTEQNPYTDVFTALEEFNLGAWHVERGDIDALTPGNWNTYTTNPCFSDSDYDAIPDGWEAYVDLNPRGNDASGDLDEDLLTNREEFFCTDATNVYWYTFGEADFMPSDNLAYTGIRDLIEEWPNKPWPTNPNKSAGLGFADGADTDGDQILDSFEKDPNCNPTCVDTDHDWLPDAWECYYGTDPLVRDAFLDYDGDGLANWQEYLAGAVWAWQYDKWYDLARIEGGFGPKGPGYTEVDMFDFFVSAGDRDAMGSTFGGFGRHPHPWDVAFGARSRISGTAETTYLYYFLLGEPRNGLFQPQLVSMEGLSNTGISDVGEDLSETGFNEIIVDGTVGNAEHVTESRWTYSQSGAVKHATCDPWDTDTDHDGMDDYYEAFHGLNPLYGGQMLSTHDIVGKTDPLNNDNPYPSYETGFPWDILSYPWLIGDPDSDPDKDGLSSREESANFYVSGGTHHTDPSPYWITDPSYERSFVNLYYQPGRVFSSGIGMIPPLWYFGFEGGPGAPRYAFDFEVNEGYDTDNDNVPDRSEATVDELSAKADPLDFDNPRRRKALYFNGVDAAARTRGVYSVEDVADLRNFTVETWICPVNPAAGHVQTIIERSAVVPQDTAQGGLEGKRLNFRLSITETGALRGEFHNYQGAHVTMESSTINAGLRAGVWTHVAMTYDGSPSKVGYLTIYVNGRSVGSTPSNLQAFNGVLQDNSVEYTVSATTNSVSTSEEKSYRYFSSPIVLGASDANPGGEVNGHVEYAYGTVSMPATEPVLEDFFQGWMDEVRIWNGAASEESIRSRMFDRMDRASVLANLNAPADKVSGNTCEIRFHYSFDSLPDVLPAADRDPEAYLYPSDVETLPVGFSELYTAPVDGSYPGIRWWDTSVWRAYHYDARHLPWIENSVAHLPKVPVRDVPRILATVNDAGDVMGWSETVWESSYGSVSNANAQLSANTGLSGANRYEGIAQPAAWLPNVTDPYNTTYATVQYGTNFIWSATTNGTPGYVHEGYDVNEGAGLGGDAIDWATDLLPLGGAVGDIDVELWDGLGVGYFLATVDTDGDGIPDWWETLYGLDPFDASDAWDDDDHDDLDNRAEYLAGTHPFAADTDGDGYFDYYDRDTDKSLTYGELYDDGDSMPSWWEVLYGLDPRSDDGAEDSDGDGWSNYAEYLAGSDPKQSSNFPVPPVVANITYDGNQSVGNVVLYAWQDPAMRGRPDAVYAMPVQPKDAGVLQIDNEYLATIHEGQRTYSGKFAYANVVNDDTFAINVYETESVYWQSHTLKGERTPDFYCRHCGIIYPTSAMVALSSGLYRCPKGHGPLCQLHPNDGCYYEIEGRSSKLVSGVGAYGTMDYNSGEWTITLPDEDDAGYTLVATYTTTPESVFPLSMRRKWTSVIQGGDPSVIQGGHLREGENRFFAFLDLDGDFLYDQNEPAGMALYQPLNVGVGTVEITVPLTDVLTGYPRFGWEPVEGANEYFVSVALGSTALVTKQSVGSRPFFFENDVASQNGVNLAASRMPTYTWSVFTNVNDTVPCAEGTATFDVYSTTRKTLSVIAPAEGAVVSDASLLLKWEMDWRNEGVSITLTNTDTGNTPLNGVVSFPQRVGSLSGDYHYELEPQKTLCRSTLVDLPDGHYTLTIGEFVQSTGVTKQSKTIHFIIDRTGSIDPNAKTDSLGSISGTIRYYGKVPFAVTDEIVGAFDGVSTRLTGALTQPPIPGAVTVKVVSGGKTLFTASDIGAQDGYSQQGLSSTYGSMIQTGSYVVYGDSPAVSLELETPPVAGAQLVVSYKHYGCPIRIQAFSTEMDDGASFSVAPAAQVTVYNKGAFTLPGLPQGTYYLRAFIDQNYNSFCDSWESRGYAMKVLRSDIGINNFAAIAVPPGASNVDILIRDCDTDADQLPDAWEYFYFNGLTGQGGYTSKKAGVLLWQEYADGELDSNPLVEDTDGDGLPDVIEHQIGSNNHAWDSDGDGIGDLEEFLAGSDPTDATSKRHFAAPTPTFLEDGTPALLFETPYLTPGTYLKYELLAKDSLDDPEWTTAGFSELIGVYKDEPVGVAPGLVAVPDPDASAASGFYKVKAHFESDTLLDK